MKNVKPMALVLVLALLLTACAAPPVETEPATEPTAAPTAEPTAEPTTEPTADPVLENAVMITLSDAQILVDGNPAGMDPEAAVYIANDIIYYESGKDFTYGEGTEADAHTPDEAAAHTVVHITDPGTYSLTGKLTKGQIAVDLGEDAEENPSAVVTLILNGVDITCDVAPGVIFYNVFECSSDDTDTATKDVDTSAAGANVIIADGTENTVRGAYVARIYKPGTVVLNEAGTEVEDAKKLHKYDGAFYSRKSLNVGGGELGTGVLNIHASNEGLDSELHLTINGGNINIFSGNDGINTNEDGVSVTTVNGGILNILVTGETGEGDGIDSNGWLVINGGTVIASACANSADAGIDSDMGIHINGGTVIAGGHMLDRIQDGGQTHAVFTFAQRLNGTDTLCFKNEAGEAVMRWQPDNACSIVVFSSPELKEGVYTLWSGETQLAGQGGMGGMGGMPGMNPGGMAPLEGMEPPMGGQPTGGEPPMGEPPAGGMEPPGGETPPQRPEGQPGGNPGQDFGQGGDQGAALELTAEFRINVGANMFGGIAPLS